MTTGGPFSHFRCDRDQSSVGIARKIAGWRTGEAVHSQVGNGSMFIGLASRPLCALPTMGASSLRYSFNLHWLSPRARAQLSTATAYHAISISKYTVVFKTIPFLNTTDVLHISTLEAVKMADVHSSVDFLGVFGRATACPAIRTMRMSLDEALKTWIANLSGKQTRRANATGFTLPLSGGTYTLCS